VDALTRQQEGLSGKLRDQTALLKKAVEQRNEYEEGMKEAVCEAGGRRRRRL
jgi:hypothetical protein